jgi:hypothetical protein
MNIFQKIKGFVKRWNSQPEPLAIPREKLVDPEYATRQARKESRWMVQYLKFLQATVKHRSPKIMGARLARLQDNCSPRHLTKLCRGAERTWNDGLPL